MLGASKPTMPGASKLAVAVVPLALLPLMGSGSGEQ
jgi:hypothetical protein